jgi:hypothetical protein
LLSDEPDGSTVSTAAGCARRKTWILLLKGNCLGPLRLMFRDKSTLFFQVSGRAVTSQPDSAD